MSGYASGVRVEHAVIAHLRRDGYFVSRGAGSKGDLGDIIAVKEGEIVFVNVKRTTYPGPGERAQLVNAARCLPGTGVPVVAIGRPQLTYWRLTGYGRRDCVPWTPDQVVTA